jgi:1-phosphatidylinositol phosphodiesterase
VEAKWKKSQAAKTTNDAELTAIVVTEPAQEAMEEKKEPEQEPNEGWVESLQEAALDGIGFVATVGGAAVETVAHGVAAAALSAADCATLGMVDSIGDMQEEQYEAMIDGRDDVTAGIEAHMEADWYRSPPPNDMSDWMSKLPDETLLTKMWIPGTHDTVSDGGGDLAECQSWSVKDQLESGIRVFDIRMKHDGDELKGFHGIIDMHHGFAEVVGALEDFIAKNPREVIMVRLKKEGEAGEHANKFHDQVIKSLGKPELWDLRVKQFGTLGSHRGKIIFLAYYSQMLLQRQKLEVQDSYKTADEDAKFELIKTHSQKVNDADTLSLNFCSAVGMDGWTCFKAPGAVAFQLNKTLMESMASQETKLGPGCFFLDFPGPQVVKNIIQANK